MAPKFEESKVSGSDVGHESKAIEGHRYHHWPHNQEDQNGLLDFRIIGLGRSDADEVTILGPKR